MSQSAGGKRVLAKAAMPLGAKIALWSSLGLLLIAALSYIGLCAYADGADAVFPNTVAALGGDLSGLTRAQAVEAVRAASEREYDSAITVECGDFTTRLGGPFLRVDADQVAEEAFRRGREGGFLSRGAAWLGAALGEPVLITAQPDLLPDMEEKIAALTAQLNGAISSTLVETSYEVTDKHLVMRKGTAGTTISAQTVREGILEAATTGREQVSFTPEITQPAELDFEAIYRDVFLEPTDAYFDKEQETVVPSADGVSFDIAAARQLLAQTPQGAVAMLALTYAPPAVTTEALSQILFRDELGSSTTYCSGNSNRLANIKTAASRLDGVILLPGETLSYNDTVGPYTTESGYLPAGTYQNGKSVDALAGGICQLSSTLYWTTLKANLEIVERRNHGLNVDYLPLGCDATVYSDVTDFKFRNDTDQPLKISATMSGRSLTVTLVGTNEDGTYAKAESVTLSTDPFVVLYKPDDSIPAGSEPQRDPAYPGHNGYVVEVYRVIYDKDGKELSRTLESKNRYARQDRVMLYNSADAVALGVDPTTGLLQELPPPPVEPEVPQDPVVPADPEPSGEPAVPQEPDPGAEGPGETEQPGEPTPSQPIPDGIPTVPPAEGPQP